ncbi:hypothetical protein [Salinarchaeum laminariae]|uniref:hypothetical protein n=1 Tax=Salinarchaeum laminariae TaxID=869888 RepID=UPI0020BDD00E|nr:hypothetical protein [Salinarchaeum laminariae]
MDMTAAIGAIADPVVLEIGAFVLQGTGNVNQPQFSPAVESGGGLIATLVVGAIMLAAAPNYVDSIVEDVRQEPVASFAWGIISLIVFVIAIILLALTIVGIILVIPLAFAFILLAIMGNVLAFIAVCDEFVDNRWMALVVAAIAVAVLNVIPVVGGIISFVIGSVGMGAVIRRIVQ